MENFWISMAGVFIGGLITWLVALSYYKKASQDLKKEASELKNLTKIIARGLENSGQMKLNKDEKGEIIGLVINLGTSLNAILE